MSLLPQAVLKPYRVTSNSEIADDVRELVLEPEDPEKAITAFEAGQWVNLHLLNPDGSVWAKSAYSIANAPSELGSGKRLTLGIRVSGEFTRRARELKPGDRVQLQGPFGVFTLHRDAPRVVCLAGGIGITPLRSMIREALLADLPIDLILFYSCKTRAGCAYVDEFAKLASRHGRFRFIPVFTQEEALDAETRRIDAAMLDTHLSDYGIGEYCMCGPKGFMDKTAKLLHTKGVEPRQIRYERFN
jgi:ferredoxin-NADP reductase